MTDVVGAPVAVDAVVASTGGDGESVMKARSSIVIDNFLPFRSYCYAEDLSVPSRHLLHLGKSHSLLHDSKKSSRLDSLGHLIIICQNYKAV